MPKATEVMQAELEHPFQVRPLNQERVEIYAETPDELPPILVFSIDGDRLVLADGWHRVNAWAKCGRLAYPAIVKKGTILEAETAAGVANLSHGQPLTRKERTAWAERMVSQYGGQSRFAEALGVDRRIVSKWLQERRYGKTEDLGSARRMEVRAHLDGAPEKFKEPLKAAAKARGWTGGEIGAAVEAVQDKRIPAETRKAILAGETDPIVLNKKGEPTYHIETLARSIKDAKRSAPKVLWYAAREAQTNLMKNVPLDVLVAEVGNEAREEWIVRDLQRYVEYLGAFIASADHKLRVVS